MEFIQKVSLNYVVITSVTRDDLQDGGASHFAKAIRLIKQNCPNIPTKSGIMVGLGETKKELIDTFYDLRYSGVDILTIGQYLRPTKKHIPVSRYYHPDEFVELEKIGKNLGFKQVISGVFVRSSYNAYDAFINLNKEKHYENRLPKRDKKQ